MKKDKYKRGEWGKRRVSVLKTGSNQSIPSYEPEFVVN
jgi:hypothetical protein